MTAVAAKNLSRLENERENISQPRADVYIVRYSQLHLSVARRVRADEETELEVWQVRVNAAK